MIFDKKIRDVCTKVTDNEDDNRNLGANGLFIIFQRAVLFLYNKLWCLVFCKVLYESQFGQLTLASQNEWFEPRSIPEISKALQALLCVFVYFPLSSPVLLWSFLCWKIAQHKTFYKICFHKLKTGKHFSLWSAKVPKSRSWVCLPGPRLGRSNTKQDSATRSKALHRRKSLYCLCALCK